MLQVIKSTYKSRYSFTSLPLSAKSLRRNSTSITPFTGAFKAPVNIFAVLFLVPTLAIFF